ncbi:hypothetical protein HHI36_022456 [Cryptolaemus montrouzieri]|uniref:Uncharacterized protein n=1 Tax=Cryptolaemus montrouzieri TaxID=559131 RepID=A0ABD2N0L3_9CUCU
MHFSNKNTVRIEILNSGDTEHFYTYIKRSLNSRLNHFISRDELTSTGITDETEVAECFATQFQKVFTREDMNCVPNLDMKHRICPSLIRVVFTSEKVRKTILSLTYNVAQVRMLSRVSFSRDAL